MVFVWVAGFATEGGGGFEPPFSTPPYILGHSDSIYVQVLS
jgi:hypothetical protein